MHIHTPVSSACYIDKDATMMDILRKAEERELDVIAITDHNSVAGIAAFRVRLDTLGFLEAQGRLSPAESEELAEYRRIMGKVLVLPGFEFTATLGFHVLGIFPPQTSIRKLDHILLELNVPEDKLDEGTSEIGATADVLTAYSILDGAGALVIAAHANSTHGVAMQNFNFGGQTKISYTQDVHLHALEVTDLDSSSRRSTQYFYSGRKAEYPRRMHCIQGSDAHRLERTAADKNNSLGIGDRATEMSLPEVGFNAIKELLQSEDFTRTRPYHQPQPIDPVRQAQEAGPSLVASFHERPTTRNRGYEGVLQDVAAFANTSGGTIYLGAGASKSSIRGLEKPDETYSELVKEIAERLTPRLAVTIEPITADSKTIIVLQAPQGAETPYVLHPGGVWVRREGETVAADRDDIVRLVLGGRSDAAQPNSRPAATPTATLAPTTNGSTADDDSDDSFPEAASAVDPLDSGDAPRTGVEIVETHERGSTKYHTVRDLRNGQVVQNVTRFSARRLWRYAINEHETQPLNLDEVEWRGDIGLAKTYKRGVETRYNLVERDGDGRTRVYYGVNSDGLHGRWRAFADSEPESDSQSEPDAQPRQPEPAPVG